MTDRRELPEIEAERDCHVVWDLHRRLFDTDWRLDLRSRDFTRRHALDRRGCNCTLGPCHSEGRPGDAGQRSLPMTSTAVLGKDARSTIDATRPIDVTLHSTETVGAGV